jgi:phosphoribosylaminoimidazole (AIR) synthetase
MGVGFVIILPEENLEETLKILNSLTEAKKIGHVEKGKGIVLPSLKIKY